MKDFDDGACVCVYEMRALVDVSATVVKIKMHAWTPMSGQPERLTLLPSLVLALLLQVTCLTFSDSRGCFTETPNIEPANTCTLRPSDTAPSLVTLANPKTTLHGVRFVSS